MAAAMQNPLLQDRASAFVYMHGAGVVHVPGLALDDLGAEMGSRLRLGDDLAKLHQFPARAKGAAMPVAALGVCHDMSALGES
jgi:hypothetical protein